jgi:uncharacterized tellurite resistance protein B-like protein
VSILDWLTGGSSSSAPAESEAETVRRIARQLDQLPPEQARYIASFAYILGRVAHADLDISDDETDAMERLVSEHAGLSASQAVMVVELAKTHNQLFGGTENFLVTRDFAAAADRGQKLALLECLYAVSAADQSISAEEDQEIRRIASELKLEHSDFIAARSRYAEHLDVLRED